jgi:hypothetical protein
MMQVSNSEQEVSLTASFDQDEGRELGPNAFKYDWPQTNHGLLMIVVLDAVDERER